LLEIAEFSERTLILGLIFENLIKSVRKFATFRWVDLIREAVSLFSGELSLAKEKG
jgi:hypothetical protein